MSRTNYRTGRICTAKELPLNCEEMRLRMGLRVKHVFQKAVFPRGLQFDGKKLETAKMLLFSAC